MLQQTVKDLPGRGQETRCRLEVKADHLSGTIPLPGSEHIEVGTLARLFEDRTNSCKFVFFLAILERIADSAQGIASGLDRPIPLSELAVYVVLAAWYPHGLCRLSFGPQDMLQQAVDSIDWGHVRGSWIQSNSEE